MKFDIYAFSRCFYPKRLTVHSGYTFLSVCVFPGNWTHNLLALLTQCSTTEPQEHFSEALYVVTLRKSTNKPLQKYKCLQVYTKYKDKKMLIWPIYVKRDLLSLNSEFWDGKCRRFAVVSLLVCALLFNSQKKLVFTYFAPTWSSSALLVCDPTLICAVLCWLHWSVWKWTGCVCFL